MSSELIYMDANATEPLRPAARDAALEAMALANPSSIHRAGRAARACLEDAREAVARCFSAEPAEVVFTSGATEANALAIAALGTGRALLVGATEHDAIRAAAPGAEVIPVLGSGVVDMAALEALLARHPGALVCLMAANNETGVLHPIGEVGALCAVHGAALHVDAAQAAVRAPQDWLALGAASVAVSGHKIGGPMGAGALIMAPGHVITPILRGGGQERGRRGGTPALPAIAGLAAALAEPYDALRIASYRDEIEVFCVGMGAVSLGGGAARLANTLCLGLPGVKAETQLIALDLAGYAVSAGAACSSGKVAASHVLVAMGAGALAGQAIRVSLPWNFDGAAIAGFCRAYQAMARSALQTTSQRALHGQRHCA